MMMMMHFILHRWRSVSIMNKITVCMLLHFEFAKIYKKFDRHVFYITVVVVLCSSNLQNMSLYKNLYSIFTALFLQ